MGEEISWEGKGQDEKGRLKSTGKIVVAIDPRYFRLTEVEILTGDATKAKEKLGWGSKTTFKELVRIMMEADCRKARPL